MVSITNSELNELSSWSDSQPQHAGEMDRYYSGVAVVTRSLCDLPEDEQPTTPEEMVSLLNDWATDNCQERLNQSVIDDIWHQFTLNRD